MNQNRLTSSDVRTMSEIYEWLQHFVSRYHGFISLKFYDGVLHIHVEEETMLNTFGEIATWEQRRDEQFPVRLVAQVDGVIWFSLFTIEKAAQHGCTLTA